MVALKLEKLLQEKNKTRYWLSKETMISYGNISKMCNNETKSISFDVLNKLLIALECTPNDIFETKKEASK